MVYVTGGGGGRGLGMPGLGGAVGDAIRAMTFEEAKAWLGAAGGVGVPYTGTATTSAGIAAVWETLVPIANGDVSAMLANLSNPDPYIAKIAHDYLKRAFESANPEQFVTQYQISPEFFQQFTGRSLTDEPWWRYRRENRIHATYFPYMGGRGGVIQANDQRVHVYYGGPVLGPDQSVYDLNYDFAALQAAAQAWAAANPGDAPNQEAIERVTTQAAPPTTSDPPGGWRFNGVDGWWGPDGKFYPGTATSAPWLGGVTGVSVNQPAPAPAAASGGLPPAPVPGPSDASAPVPAETIVGTSSQDLPPVRPIPASGGALPVLLEAFDTMPADGAIPAPPGSVLTEGAELGDGIGAALNQKVLGIPVWGWGVGLAIVAGVASRKRR